MHIALSKIDGSGTDIMLQLVIFHYVQSCAILGLPIPLNEACGFFDTCEDGNASCQAGFCRCLSNFFEKIGVCGKYKIGYGC